MTGVLIIIAVVAVLIFLQRVTFSVTAPIDRQIHAAVGKLLRGAAAEISNRDSQP